jgi:hypothetical protein
MTYETSEARGYKGQHLRDWHDGLNQAQEHPVGIPFLAISRNQFADSYTNLENQEAREGFFDDLLLDIATARGRWANFYALAELLQREEWYWREQGFESFVDFWRDKTGQTFEGLAEMERVYRYAQIAAPDLFDMEFNEAAQRTHLAMLVESLAKIPAANPNGIRNKPSNQYTNKAEAIADAERASHYRSAGGNSIERRFSTLRRNHPKLAERVLAGEEKFFSSTEHGCTLNWKAIDAERGERGEAPKATRGGASKKRAKLGRLESLLKTRDQTLRTAIITMVRSCKWLMDALQETSQ